MGLDGIYVHVETNDVLATSFGAMHTGIFYGRRMRSSFGAGTRLILNDTRPLPAEFEFRRVIYATPPQLTEQVL